MMTLHHQPGGAYAADAPAPSSSPELDALPAGTPAETESVASEGDAWLEMRLPRRSLYVLRGEARYGWAHSIRLSAVPTEIADSERCSPIASPTAAPSRVALIFRDAPDS